MTGIMYRFLICIFLLYLGIYGVMDLSANEIIPHKYMESFLPADFFSRIKKGDYNRKFYPEFSDRQTWEKVKKQAIKKKLIKQIMSAAEKIINEEIPLLDLENYRKFAINGTRNEYEQPYFKRRHNFGVLVLALCLSGNEEKYLPCVINYLNAIMEEWTWCLPAHAQWHGTWPEILQPCDLYTAETGAQLALTFQILGQKLDSKIPGLSDKIRQMVLERAVYSPLNPASSHLDYNGWFYYENPNNWTVWCSLNNLTSLIILENNPRITAKVIELYLHGVSRFIANTPEDGFCAEGANYYPVSNGFVYKLAELLHYTVPGSMDKFFKEPKIRGMIKFISSLRIGDFCMTYGDAPSPNFNFRHDTIVPAGIMLNDTSLIALGTSKIPEFQSRCGDTLKLHLSILFHYPDKISELKEKEEKISFFKDNMGIVRSKKFSVGIKAGHNGQSHNHNDLGHFSIHYKNKPLIIDCGTAPYGKVNFSDQRYNLWYIRGNGHNAPVFNGIEQQYGKSYYASLNAPEQKNNHWLWQLDLSQAYPENAGIKKYIRHIDFTDTQVTITDDFQLKYFKQAEVNLFSVSKPEIRNNELILGDVILKLDGWEFVKIVPAENIQQDNWQIPGTVSFQWNAFLWRIVLKSTVVSPRMLFTEK